MEPRWRQPCGLPGHGPGGDREGRVPAGRAGVCAFGLTVECPLRVTVVNRDSLARGSRTAVRLLDWGPQHCIRVRPKHGILGAQWVAVPHRDTCHFGIPPGMPEPLCVPLWPLGQLRRPTPSAPHGALGGTLGRRKERCGRWSCLGGVASGVLT